MEQIKVAWLPLAVLIALVSIPPLFGHEILAIIAGFVYGTGPGFAILAISSIIGESIVYFTLRTFFHGYLNSFRQRFGQSYGVFVTVVEDGGILMLWLIRMSIIPPHFSTPLFSSLDNITWWKWMIANVAASPVKFYPPVFIGSLLRDERKNSLVGDFALAISILITVAVLWIIRRKYIEKKRLSATEEQASEVIVHATILPDPEKGSGATGAVLVEPSVNIDVASVMPQEVDITEVSRSPKPNSSEPHDSTFDRALPADSSREGAVSGDPSYDSSLKSGSASVNMRWTIDGEQIDQSTEDWTTQQSAATKEVAGKGK